MRRSIHKSKCESLLIVFVLVDGSKECNDCEIASLLYFFNDKAPQVRETAINLYDNCTVLAIAVDKVMGVRRYGLVTLN